MTWAWSVAAVVAAYAIGSLSFAVIVSRVMGLADPRSYGSGNPGATNVLRTGNRAAAIVTLALDALKGFVPVLLAFIGAEHHHWWGMGTVALCGLAAFLGHVWPVFFRFKGGKGVATAFGIFVVFSPWAALGGLGAYLVLYAVTRISSVGSLAGTLACVVGVVLHLGIGSPVAWAAMAVTAMIWWRHRENIRRLLSGEEKRKMKV